MHCNEVDVARLVKKWPVGALLATGLLAAWPAQAQSVEQFYAGRQVKFSIGSPGGGGYDFYSRIVGRYLTRHMPGHPLFVMQNMPGAGGVVVANYLYNIAPRDGSEIAMLARGAAT